MGFIEGDEEYDKIRIWAEKRFPKKTELLKEFHALIVANGKREKRAAAGSAPLKKNGGPGPACRRSGP